MVRIWDTDSGVYLRTIRGRYGGMFAAAFDPEGGILATGCHDGTSLWDVKSGELRTGFDTGPCFAVSFSPENRILVTASDVSEVRLWGLSADFLPCLLSNNGGPNSNGASVPWIVDRRSWPWRTLSEWSLRSS
jgi:WD40 repeat protein